MAKAKTKPVAKKTARRTPATGVKKLTPAVGSMVVPEAPAGPVLRKLRSVIYTVADLPRAKSFYGAVLGRQPYFDQPYYVGFDIDGQELGLDPDTKNRKPGPGGAVAYWRVDDISESWVFSISNGADPLEPPHAVGEGISVAVVADPFGNYI